MFDAWQFPTLAWGDPTLPSALRRFTSEFGMGSGGTTALKPPGKFLVPCPVSFVLILRWLPSRHSVTYLCMLLPAGSVAALSQRKILRTSVRRTVLILYPSQAENHRVVSQHSPERFWCCKVKPHGSLVPVSSTHRCAYTPGLSTS